MIHALLALALAAPGMPSGPAPQKAGAKPSAQKPPPALLFPPGLTAPAPPPGKSSVPLEGRTVLNRVAGSVNGEVVTMRDLQERAGGEWARVAMLPAGPDKDQASRRVLRRAWDAVLADKLFHGQAVTLAVEVSDGQVDSAIEDIKARNQFSDQQLDLALAGQGMDRAAFKAQIKRELESMQVLNYRVRSRVKVSEEDLQNYYKTHPAAFGGEEELHVRHLFLGLPADAPASGVQAAQGRMEALRARLAAGEDFAALAREVGGGDGDLGWLKRGQIQKELEAAFVELADGQVSQPVRAGAGLHLFKVEARRRAGGRTFEQAKDEIRETLTQEQTASYRDQYIAELKRDAVIDVRMPELKD